jgi:hypothetical protein
MSEIKVNKISPRTNCGTVTLGDSGDSFAIATCASFKTKDVKDASGNIIISRCGSNITIGSSGAAVALAAGATQSGFGRTGTVNWDTTAKTTTVTAASGVGYFVDTTSGAVTVNLPAGSAGDIVAVSDYANTAATNNIVIGPNGADNIQGVNGNYLINVNGGTVTLVYVDATQGWRPTDAATASSIIEQPLFTVATGGTITCDGDYKIHTFTGPGTFTVTQLGNGPTNPAGGPNTVSYLVVAGGGGNSGGAGGYREGRDIGPSYTASPKVAPAGLTITSTAYSIIVGGGGANFPSSTKGSDSIFSTITSAGGGSNTPILRDGGSGSGANNATPGAGNTPPVSPPQGFPGGPNVNGQGSSGGGGATEAGAPNNGPNNPGGRGGAGTSTSITGSPLSYTGGGGGPANAGLGLTGGPTSPCGTGGAGAGAGNPTGGNGTTNRGGGGGGGGGSGVVVIRYKFQ